MRVLKVAVVAASTSLSGVVHADPDRVTALSHSPPDPSNLQRAIALDLAAVARAPAALREHESRWAGSADAEAPVFSRAELVVTVGARYEPVGFSMRPAVIPRLRYDQSFAKFRLAAQVAVSQSLVDDQRSGAVTLDAVRSVGASGFVGLHGSAALDLERDADDPVGETDLELHAEPWLGIRHGQALLFVSGGPVLSRLRFEQTRRGECAEIGISVGF
jgi:hypothetical protein